MDSVLDQVELWARGPNRSGLDRVELWARGLMDWVVDRVDLWAREQTDPFQTQLNCGREDEWSRSGLS